MNLHQNVTLRMYCMLDEVNGYGMAYVMPFVSEKPSRFCIFHSGMAKVA